MEKPTNKTHYYYIELEISLHNSERVFGFVNISHIPYENLHELFKDQLTTERFLFDESFSYFITPELYEQHKEYLDRQISFTFDFKLFQYSVGLSSIEIDKYQKDYKEELPPLFKT